MAILIEHTGGKWPFWLSPRQAIIIPVGGSKFFDYAEYVCNYLSSGKSQNYFVDVDRSTNSLNKKIKTAQLSQYNFIIVVGEKEKDTQTINVRRRDGELLGSMTLGELLKHFDDLSINHL